MSQDYQKESWFDSWVCTLLDPWFVHEVIHDEADVIFACDGAFSAVRYNGMQKLDRFDYLQDYIDDGYKELLLPANEDGSYKLDKNVQLCRSHGMLDS